MRQIPTLDDPVMLENARLQAIQRTPRRLQYNQYHRDRRKRSPKWRNKLLISKVYAQARQLTTSSEQYDVDHIIPLTSPVVSGLHVHDNLQILTRSANSIKANTYTIL